MRQRRVGRAGRRQPALVQRRARDADARDPIRSVERGNRARSRRRARRSAVGRARRRASARASDADGTADARARCRAPRAAPPSRAAARSSWAAPSVDADPQHARRAARRKHAEPLNVTSNGAHRLAARSSPRRSPARAPSSSFAEEHERQVQLCGLDPVSATVRRRFERRPSLLLLRDGDRLPRFVAKVDRDEEPHRLTGARPIRAAAGASSPSAAACSAPPAPPGTSPCRGRR